MNDIDRMKLLLQERVENVFVEIEKNSGSRLEFVSNIVQMQDSDYIEAFRVVLARIAKSPTKEESLQGIDTDAARCLDIISKIDPM